LESIFNEADIVPQVLETDKGGESGDPKLFNEKMKLKKLNQGEGANVDTWQKNQVPVYLRRCY
jgi:hypothetical protein